MLEPSQRVRKEGRKPGWWQQPWQPGFCEQCGGSTKECAWGFSLQRKPSMMDDDSGMLVARRAHPPPLPHCWSRALGPLFSSFSASGYDISSSLWCLSFNTTTLAHADFGGFLSTWFVQTTEAHWQWTPLYLDFVFTIRT